MVERKKGGKSASKKKRGGLSCFLRSACFAVRSSCVFSLHAQAIATSSVKLDVQMVEKKKSRSEAPVKSETLWGGCGVASDEKNEGVEKKRARKIVSGGERRIPKSRKFSFSVFSFFACRCFSSKRIPMRSSRVATRHARAAPSRCPLSRVIAKTATAAAALPRRKHAPSPSTSPLSSPLLSPSPLSTSSSRLHHLPPLSSSFGDASSSSSSGSIWESDVVKKEFDTMMRDFRDVSR